MDSGIQTGNLFVQAHRHSIETDGSNGNEKLWKAGNFSVTFTSFKQICKFTFRSSSMHYNNLFQILIHALGIIFKVN